MCFNSEPLVDELALMNIYVAGTIRQQWVFQRVSKSLCLLGQ